MIMKKRPLILVTNDDGIHSPGLYAAASVAVKSGDVLIAAPHTQQTGMGRSFPGYPDNGVIEKIETEDMKLSGEITGNKILAYGIHGTPALAVAHGILELAEHTPDLCIGGINYGENLGSCLTCSGTLGALFEASSYGIPGIAVSVEAKLEKQRSTDFETKDWSAAQYILEKYIRKTLETGIPEGADAWNINVPDGLKFPYPERRTVQSRQSYFYFEKPEKRIYSEPCRLRSKKDVDIQSLESDSDIYAIYMDQIASVTLLNFDMSVKEKRL